MPGNYTLRRTYVDGDILSAADYVADNQQHIDNQTPQGTDDYSDGVAQMRLTTDTGDVSGESLATSLAGELERVRFVLKDIKSKLFGGGAVAQWYSKSYSNVPGDGVVTAAKLADNATFIQYIEKEDSGVISTSESTLVSQAITLTRTHLRISATLTCRYTQTGSVTLTSDITMNVYSGATLLGSVHGFVRGGFTDTLTLPVTLSFPVVIGGGPGAKTITIKAVSTNLSNVSLTGAGRLVLEEVA